MPNIDAELLAGGETRPEQETEDEPRSLRQRVQAARKAMDLKQKAKDKLEEKIIAPAKSATSQALRWAWTALIPSFGLSLIYINIHVFLKAVFGEKLFCKLGEEWIPKQVAGAGGEAGKMANKSIGLVEVMALMFLDAILLIIIVGIVSLFVNESSLKAISEKAISEKAIVK